jgi:peptidoglycan/LPS O-acetylase OafA/YrhL
MSDFKYRPDIDGLRAIAIIMVILFHAKVGFVSGFIGVDVFFVISGYLITGLILKQQETGTFQLKDFWIRRVRRILPASLVMSLAVLVVAGFLFIPEYYEETAKSSIHHLLMMGNIYFWNNSGYFDVSSELQPLLHTWSLAVEEQFYLLYPFLLWWMGGWGKKSRVGVLTGLFVVSLISSEILVRYDSVSSFYLLPSRAWEMIFGGLLWFLPALQGKWARESISFLSLSTIIGCGWALPFAGSFPGLSAVLPCLATALLIYANSKELSIIGKGLSSRIPVFVGLLSYSLYLWHWPLIVFVRYRHGAELSVGMKGVVLMTSVLLALISWKFIETPIRQKKLFAQTKKLFKAAVGVPAILILFAGLVDLTEGLPQRLNANAQRLLESQEESHYYRSGSHFSQVMNDDVPVRGDREGEYSVMIWGDSHAAAITQVLDKICQRKGIKCFQISSPGTPPILFREGYRYGDYETALHNQKCLEFCLRNDVDQVVMIGRWIKLNELASFRAEHGSTKESLQLTIKKFTSAGVDVVLLEDYPHIEQDKIHRMVEAAWEGENLSGFTMTLEEHRLKTAEFHEVFKSLESPRLRVYDPTLCFFDENGVLPYQEGGLALYRDAHHLTEYGARKMIPLLEKIIGPSHRETADNFLSERY